MKTVVLVAVLSAAAPLVADAQTRQAAPRRPPAAAAAPTASDRTSDAYAQFLQAHVFADAGKVEDAIAAYRRAMALDATAATIPAELAELYQAENRLAEAQTAAEQALKIDDANKQAHRVLGQMYAAKAGTAQDTRAGRPSNQENITQAINHFERTLETPAKQTDIETRATLSQLYVAAEQFDKAIPLLMDIVKEAPSWRNGTTLLVEAYSGAGKSKEAIDWLEESAPDNPQLYSTLAGFYAQARRWVDAAGAYDQALKASPRNACAPSVRKKRSISLWAKLP